MAWSWSKEPLDGDVTGARLRYGAAIQLGQGQARTYVLRDQKTGDPVEVGVALTEGALQGLPETGHHGGNGHEHYASYILELPANHGTPYRFVELDSFTATFIIGSWGGKVIFDEPMITRCARPH